MGPKEEKGNRERLILPGSQADFFSHTISMSHQPKGGGLPHPGAESIGDGKPRGVCVPGVSGRGGGRGGEKREIQGSGHLPRKITNILQKRNPKTEVIVWKKSVSQTLEPELRPSFFMFSGVFWVFCFLGFF